MHGTREKKKYRPKSTIESSHACFYLIALNCICEWCVGTRQSLDSERKWMSSSMERTVQTDPTLFWLLYRSTYCKCAEREHMEETASDGDSGTILKKGMHLFNHTTDAIRASSPEKQQLSRECGKGRHVVTRALSREVASNRMQMCMMDCWR